MYELIYRSIAKSNINNDDISSILKTSQNFNSKHDITGCLLYHKHEFIQILEGDKKIVKELYANIEKDSKHFDVMLLTESDKEVNTFSKWSMAFYELGSDDIKNSGSMLFINNFITIADIVEKPTNAIKLFWYISKQLLQE